MAAFNQSEVEYLVGAKKFIHRTIENNTDWMRRPTSSSAPAPTELRITYDIRRKDNPGAHIGLQFNARKALVPQARWGTSLRWRGQRIRGIDYKLREDVIRDGLIVGKIRHWHEHVWTDQEGDKKIVDVNGIIGNEDMRSMLELCLDRWNIEGFGHQLRLDEQK